jgi:hypothetical protein
MYVVNVYYYLYNFRNTVNCATMKTEIPIENGRSLKLRQTGLGAIAPHLQPAPNQRAPHCALTGPQMGPWEEHRGRWRRDEGSEEEMERSKGM